MHTCAKNSCSGCLLESNFLIAALLPFFSSPLWGQQLAALSQVEHLWELDQQCDNHHSLEVGRNSEKFYSQLLKAIV
jgi:hypothetical protein